MNNPRDFQNRKGNIFFVPIVITLLIISLAIINPPVIDEYLETLLLDYRFKIRNLLSKPHVPDDILIVSIDEKSLTEYGRWPWNRTLQAELIEKVFKGSPKVAGVDIFYPEPEQPRTDNQLAKVFNKYRDNLVMALGFEAEEKKEFNGEIDDVLYDYVFTKLENFSFVHSVRAFRVLLPHEPVKSSAPYGHVYSLADRDGKLRWENLYIQLGDEYFPSFALQISRIARGISFDNLKIIGGSGVSMGDLFIPTDKFGRMHINYLGRDRTFPYISASDILSDSVSNRIFKDKIVLIGTSALSTYDLKNTPFSANMPGVEKHATVVANIMDERFIKKLPAYLDILVILMTGIVALVAGSRRSALYSFIFYTAILYFILASNQFAFSFFNLRLNLTYPLLNVLGIGIFIIGYQYFIEEKKAREIRRMFSSYVTERVVNALIRNPEMARLGGERRKITVLFSDISGFTSYSEKHAPEEVVSILNEYLTAMTDVIFRWEGTLDKFIGDAIVAFWGAPLEQKNHAELAVRCSLHMMKRLGELQQKWESEGKLPLSMGIGLNTGEVLVGNIGAEGKKMDYTVIGDHVNIGARVESLTRKFDANILMTEMPLNEITELVRTCKIGHISIKGVGRCVVKGKEKAIGIYEISSLEDSERSSITECEATDVIHLKDK